MQANTSLRRHHLNLLLWLLVALGVALLSLLPLAHLRGRPISPAPSPQADSHRIAYLEYGADRDTLWAAETANPSKRQSLLSIPHARDFGVVPRLSPDRGRLAYTMLPPETMAPSAASPAQLWLGRLDGDEKPRLLAQAVDLLVAPLWSPQGDSLVFRRGSDFRLISVDLATGRERDLVAGAGAALFPVGFSPDAASLYYVRITSADSSLYAFDFAGGNDRKIAQLSDGLTRDWQLSPAGDRIAYLAMSLDATSVASRAFVLDLATAVVSPAGPEGDAFSPVWGNNGELALGTIAGAPAAGAIVRLNPSSEATFGGPSRGFDVPLGFAPSGRSLVVRNFDGGSAVNPGRQRLEVLSADGSRKTITNNEVTFLGWIDP